MDCNFTFKCKKKFGHQNKISKKTMTQEHEQHIKFSTRLKEKHCVLSYINITSHQHIDR